MNVLVTGGAGFIGSHLCERLLRRGHIVWAIDNFDPFYDPAIKEANVARLNLWPGFRLLRLDIRDPGPLLAALNERNGPAFDVVVHLAARAGVRPSIEEPLLYSQVNLDGTVALLEIARQLRITRFVFGSSSSVYGNNETVPFAENQPVDHPISPYAATKRAGELLCHTYHHLYGMGIACLRFFTVYGPGQRPDLAIHKFTSLITAGKPVPMFGDGTTERDYTYVDDIVDGIEGSIEYTATHPGSFEILNLGGSRTTSLRRLVELIAAEVGREPVIQRLPMQPGDVLRTFADVRKAHALLGYDPRVRIEEGIPRFVDWYTRWKATTGQVRREASAA
jgi:UDP-glucuronate 4-epimerase